MRVAARAPVALAAIPVALAYATKVVLILTGLYMLNAYFVVVPSLVI